MIPDRRSFLLAGGASVAGLLTPDSAAADAPADAKKFIAEHESRVKPLEIEAGLAWWRAKHHWSARRLPEERRGSE